MTGTQRRVKLYKLNSDKQWEEIGQGTGHVTILGVSLLVQSETDGSLLLDSTIQQDTAYQKQQETLIAWSQGHNYVLCLSFQDKAGCHEIWEKICQVQNKDHLMDITQDVTQMSDEEWLDEDMSVTEPPVELPPCELQKLETIDKLISSCLSSALHREKLSAALKMEGYIRKLLNLFHICEDSENLEGLHYLFRVFKNIFLLNKNALFEVMFAEDTIFDVVGCLEYDPNTKVHKRHRDYLRQKAKFKEVIPITNPKLLAKIHQTYRVQYIQDAVLPTLSIFEENMPSTLPSFVFFNKMDIVSLIQDDEAFLNELFRHLMDKRTEASKRRDLALFLKECCTFAQTLQPQSRKTFFKTLASLGILPALEITLVAGDPATKSASSDILFYIVEINPSLAREFILQQVNRAKDGEQFLLNIIIEQMMCDSDPELGCVVQLSGILRLLLDSENMLTSRNHSEKANFLNFFYKYSMDVLVTPLLGDWLVKEDDATAQLLDLILELLSLCVEHHTNHLKNYILNRDLLRRILVLMISRHLLCQ